MKYFMKLNIMGTLYALALFVAIELILNVYRISRLTGWDLGSVINVITILVFAGFVGATFLFILMTKRWMKARKSSYWSVVLWAPYLVFYVYIFASLFPIIDPGEVPSPGVGLVLIAALFVYPFYVALVNFVGVNLRRG